MSEIPGTLSHWLKNQSLVRFSSGTTELEQVAYSNTVVTPWIGPRLKVSKQCNVTTAALGQSLTYQIEIVNTGNRTAIVRVVDPLSQETSLLPNSVLRNGIPLPGVSPAQGLPPAEIAPGAVLTYHFQVVIVRVPENLTLLNQAEVKYEFVTTDRRTVNGTEKSNVVEVRIETSRLEVSLQVDRSNTFAGDILMYTVLVSNPGFAAATDAVLTVRLPQGAIFIPASVTINDMFAPQVTPDAGIDLGDIGPGSVVRVQYRVQVTVTQVTGSQAPDQLSSEAVLKYITAGKQEVVYSNVVTLIIVEPQISVVKTVSPVITTPGDTAQYHITVSNQSNYAVDAKLQDVLPAALVFVEGSLSWNGVKRPGSNPNTGINLGTLTARSELHIQFEAQVENEVAGAVTSTQHSYVNRAVLLYTFRLPDSRTVQRRLISNEAVLEVRLPVIQVHVEVFPPIVEQGGTVTFNVSVSNTGSLPARVQLGNILPQGAKWVGQESGPMQLNVPEYSTPRYLHIGELGAGSVKEFAYLVQLAPEQTGILQGTLTALYTYEWNAQRRSGETRSNEYTILVEAQDE
ncbi:hypothetical protein NKT34_13070 [Paenibacillus polysaccharolyticus]|uniref:DUF11 domain-containing protein n=1 Tax=Paenibacillus polysaccharolyticus TaxID=582692 RepID=UPI0012B71656|nr:MULTISPECIES: DUF11 domain-containing protein [Paenibacillus]MCP1134228.1 hypothetical protein [Paenibacillus polysaccharolyticus]